MKNRPKCGICKDEPATHVLFFETYETCTNYNNKYELKYHPNQQSHITGSWNKNYIDPTHCQKCTISELNKSKLNKNVNKNELNKIIDGCLGSLTSQLATKYLQTKQDFSQHVSELNKNGYTIIEKEKICSPHDWEAVLTRIKQQIPERLSGLRRNIDRDEIKTHHDHSTWANIFPSKHALDKEPNKSTSARVNEKLGLNLNRCLFPDLFYGSIAYTYSRQLQAANRFHEEGKQALQEKNYQGAVECFIQSKLQNCTISGINGELEIAEKELRQQNNNSKEVKEWLRQTRATKPNLTKTPNLLYIQKCNILVRGPTLGSDYNQSPHIDSPVSNLILLLPDFVWGSEYPFYCIPSSHLVDHDVKSSRMIDTKLPLGLMKDVEVGRGKVLLFYESLIHGGKGTSNGKPSKNLKDMQYWGTIKKQQVWFPDTPRELPTDVSFQFTFGIRSHKTTAYDVGAGHNYWYHNTEPKCKIENGCGTCENCVNYCCWKQKLDKLKQEADPHSLHNQKKYWYDYIRGSDTERCMTRGRST